MNEDLLPTLFAIYSEADIPRVRLVVEALRNVGVDVWIATDRMRPGANFDDQIMEAINNATAALVFVSPALAESDHAFYELRALHERVTLIIPVLLERATNLPVRMEVILAPLQQIDLTTQESGIPLGAVDQIRVAVAHASGGPSVPRGAEVAEHVREGAASLARAVRKGPPTGEETAAPPKAVFIVHGHDDSLLGDVERHLQAIGIESVVLRRIGGPAQSLFQKFMQWGTDTRFALVLLSADDLGVSRAQYQAEGVGVHALQFRARQNVILELGFFYGHLGWENVFVLFKKPDKLFPNFERPSDLDGVVFDMVEESGQWKGYLEQKLKDAGFSIESRGQ